MRSCRESLCWRLESLSIPQCPGTLQHPRPPSPKGQRKQLNVLAVLLLQGQNDPVARSRRMDHPGQGDGIEVTTKSQRDLQSQWERKVGHA